MSRKKYRSIACAIALATSFAGTQGLVYAAATEVPAADSSVTTDAAAMAAQSTGAAPAAQPAAESTGTPDASPAPAEAAPAAPADAQAAAAAQWNASRPDDKVVMDQITAYDGKTIVAVNIHGAGEKTMKTAEAAIQSKVGTAFAKNTVSNDGQALLDTGYFYDLYPSFEEVPEGVILTYNVLENPVLKSVEIKGNSKAEPTEKLQKLITVPVGEILNRRVLADNVEAIQKQYATDGYILAKVSNLNINDKGELTISINEGVLEGYKVKGNTKTKERVIVREMRTKIGEPLNKKQVTRSYQRITNLGFFESVDVRPTPGVEPNAVVLEIAVTEKRTGTLGIGAGYSSSDGVVGMFNIGDTNFRGTGDAISLTYQVSGSDTDARGYTFSYTHPWMDKKQTSGTLRIYNRTYSYDDYDTEGTLQEEYMRKYSGGEITLGRPVSEYSTNYVTLRNRNDKYERHVSNTDRSGSAYDTWRNDNFGLTRSITLAHVTDTRDNYFFPMSGGRVSLTAEIAGLGGDFSYQKYTVEDQRYRKVGHAQVIALRGMYGHSGQQLPESAKYKLGGQDTLRGYRDDMFRDNSMFLRTIEYRFPVISKVQGALFTDFGGVWNSGWMPENMHSSIGFGLQIQTPVGPMRVDLAHGSQGNRVHFTVGTTF